jgi:hypothetical protein
MIPEPALLKPTPSTAVNVDEDRFSDELRGLLERLGDAPVFMQDLLNATEGRGFYLMLVLIALPFIGPIPLPGFSIPFGLVITVLGSALAFGHKPWLPQKFLQLRLPPRSLGKLLRGTASIMEFMERFLRPRLGFVESNVLFSRVAGFFIAVSGLFMMLPLPLPLSNSLPAWTVIFLALGALGRDGLFFFIGCVSFVVSIAFFTLVVIGGNMATAYLLRLMPAA